jgi:hypothetical protein
MAKIKLKQILSNLDYDEINNILTISGSHYPALLVTGSILVSGSENETGSVTIEQIDTFGDSGSFDSIDLGSY